MGLSKNKQILMFDATVTNECLRPYLSFHVSMRASSVCKSRHEFRAKLNSNELQMSILTTHTATQKLREDCEDFRERHSLSSLSLSCVEHDHKISCFARV